MKKLLLVILVSWVSTSTGEELSKSSQLSDLRLGLLVKQDIVLHQAEDGGGEFRHNLKLDKVTGFYSGFLIQCDHPYAFRTGTSELPVLIVKSLMPVSVAWSNSNSDQIALNSIMIEFVSDEIDDSHPCTLEVAIVTDKNPETVGEILPYFDGKFELIDVDPYANFDNETAIKIIMKKITNSIEKSNYHESLYYFSMLERNQSDLPEEFYYYYSKALEKAGHKAKSKKYATAYLSRFGKKGKYYEQAIELMSLL